MKKTSIFRNFKVYNYHIITMSRSIKVSHKSSEIFTVILPIFKASMNLAHIKCLSMLLGALCTVQTVCLSKLAGAFGNKASRESSFRRIQRFMAQLVPDFDVVATKFGALPPKRGQRRAKVGGRPFFSEHAHPLL